MWAPIFNMGNIYAGMNYISALNQFSFGSFIPNMFNYSFIPSFYNSSIFSYMGASRVPDIDDITKSIVSSTLSPYKSVKTAKKVSSETSQGVRVGNNQNSSVWERLGYCKDAGIKLAKTALNSAVGFVGYCARYVKTAIEKCGLGKYVSGNACDMVNIMRRNKNFREVNTAGVNVKGLPAGAVVVYDRGVAGYSSSYGHVEIATGDGRCVSDGVTRNPRNNPTAIFIPVAA